MSNVTLFFIAIVAATIAMGVTAYKKDVYNTIYYAALTIVFAIMWATYMIKESL